MGQETDCRVQFGNKVAAGKALLETDELIFRGDFRLRIALKSIESVEAADGELRVVWPAGTASFALGARAQKWADKIRNPRSLADKLDVKPGMRVSLCGVRHAGFLELLRARTNDISEGKPAKESDLIFFRAAAAKDLAKLRTLQTPLKRTGAIWVVYPKGRQEITELGVLQAGREAGLVDIKVARFSDTHTALKFVVPLARR